VGKGFSRRRIAVVVYAVPGLSGTCACAREGSARREMPAKTRIWRSMGPGRLETPCYYERHRAYVSLDRAPRCGVTQPLDLSPPRTSVDGRASFTSPRPDRARSACCAPLRAL